ncbi:MAG: hypothetical protein GJV46_16215 [Geobacter sp.]|nr:hypothetical protein [Geobacter sp.]
MKNKYVAGALSLVIGMLTLNGIAIAHGTEKHGKSAAAEAQMKKLHSMMPMFSLASAKLETALEKGEVATAEAEAEKIVAAIPDLKKSKPHKNVKQQTKFVELAANLGKTVATSVAQAKNGDLAGAKVSFKKAEEICAACHAKFRD